MDIVEFLNQYGIGKTQGTKYNQYSTIPTTYNFSLKDIEQFNKIYTYVYNQDLNIIQRTKTGAIRKGLKYWSNNYAYDIKESKTGVRLTVIVDGKIWVFKVGTIKDKDTEMPPWKAWKVFSDICRKNDINLDDYIIDNGKEYKQGIPDPLINMNQYMTKDDEGLTNCHHIDFHNSYPAGLANTHPEFRPIIESLYRLRKVSEDYKFVLNCTVGCMQSNKHPWYARWAHLAKDAIEDNVKRVTQLAFILQMNGRKILGFNTDGIWYQGPIYHGPGEGDKLGEWHNDHINCIFRSKSDGAYEFIDAEGYHPVIRGQTRLDTIKPRDKWSWGDIYQEDAKILKYEFKKGEGIIYEE